MNARQLQEKIDYIIEHRPTLAGRYQRGAELYRTNHIMVDQGDRVIVPSSKPGRCYAVQVDHRGLCACGCQDAQHGAPEINGEKLCKHAIAAHLFLKNGPFEEK